MSKVRAVTLWLVGLALALGVIAHTRFTADMSAFLPESPTPEQQLLVDQLKAGALSRLLLIGIEGADDEARARLSKGLAARLRESGRFLAVKNGETGSLEKDRELLFRYRYLLSPAVTRERFTAAGLHDAIANSIDLLASPAGLLLKGLLTRDPTGEMVELVASLDAGGAPASRHGVWVSRDGERALLMAQTVAAGSDTDAQEALLEGIRSDFAAVATTAGISDGHLLLSGSPVFSVDSRRTIRSEVERLSLVSAIAIVALLLVIYRSLSALALGVLPVASGVVAGIAAVSLGFGNVHGLTIGFGTTLIGEAVDYSIYYFLQSRADAGGDESWRQRFWPTIRLGVLTSACGFASLLFSGFPGLAQLGLYSIAGLFAAAAVTRFVLPHLRPRTLKLRDIAGLGTILASRLPSLALLRWPLLGLAILAVAFLGTRHGDLLDNSLSGLSPVPKSAQALDVKLRGDLGAPDLRYLVVLNAPDREGVLRAAEGVAPRLQALVEAGVIAGFETPTRFLPSVFTQRARQEALPQEEELQAALARALVDLPLRSERLAPFLAEVAAARNQPLLSPEALAGTSLALVVDSLLLPRTEGWSAILPLRAARDGGGLRDIDPAAVRAALAAAGQPGALFVDLLGESNRLYASYLREAVLLSGAGFAGIVILLALALRSRRRLAVVLLPLAVTVVLVVAGLALAGERLTLLHLVGILLTIAVGSNYALFFASGDGKPIDPRTLASLVLANITTMIGFGALAFSQVSVLHALGVTVGPGAVLALLFAAILAGGQRR